MTTDDGVWLRPVQPGDLPRMYDMQLDPESNRMAVTIPRTGEAFDSHWAKALADPGNTTRAVLVGEAMVGYISCFPMDGQDHVGYWIDRAYWGMGIASRALHLLLREVTKRPLVATAATSNGASLRVLQKCGFVVERGSPLARQRAIPGVRGSRPRAAVSPAALLAELLRRLAAGRRTSLRHVTQEGAGSART